MPKVVPHPPKPHDGAILRALRVQAGLQSTQFAAELSDLTGMSVLGPHISGYEAGTRFIPDWLVEGAARIFSKHIGKPIDPALFPDYWKRQFAASSAVEPREVRKQVSYYNKFAPERRRLLRAGLRTAAA